MFLSSRMQLCFVPYPLSLYRSSNLFYEQSLIPLIPFWSAPDAYQWFGHSHSVWSQLAGRSQVGGPEREILYLLSKLGPNHRQWVETARAAVLSARGTETPTSYAAEQARLAREASSTSRSRKFLRASAFAVVVVRLMYCPVLNPASLRSSSTSSSPSSRLDLVGAPAAFVASPRPPQPGFDQVLFNILVVFIEPEPRL